MQKVKMLLSAVAILSVVGGALAFKPARGNGQLFCSPGAGQACSTTADFNIVTTGGQNLECGTTALECQNSPVIRRVINVGE